MGKVFRQSFNFDPRQHILSDPYHQLLVLRAELRTDGLQRRDHFEKEFREQLFVGGAQRIDGFLSFFHGAQDDGKKFLLDLLEPPFVVGSQALGVRVAVDIPRESNPCLYVVERQFVRFFGGCDQ